MAGVFEVRSVETGVSWVGGIMLMMFFLDEFQSGRIRWYWRWSDSAGLRPDSSVLVGAAEFDPGFHAG